jgi:streptogramin lyase
MISSARSYWARAAISAVASAALAAGCGASRHATHTPSSAARSQSRLTAGPSQPQPQSSAALDPPPSGGVRIAAPGFPAMIAAGSGSIWVFAHRSVYAYRIDPSTNRIVAKVDLNDTPCTLASAGDGLVWNSNCGPAESSLGVSFAINPRTDRVTRRIRGNDPAFGAGSLWILNDSGSAVRRVDPQSGVVLASIPTGIDEQPGGGSLGIGGVGHGSVWLVSDSAKSVTRISTATNKVTDVITLRGAKTEDEAFPQAAEQDTGYINGASVAFTPGRAWYANPAGLFEINAHNNRATLISLPMRPFTDWGDDTVVSGAGSVWLRTTNTTIDRIDPASGKVQAVYPAGLEGGGGDITVAFGSLWVDNAGSNSVWREPIRNG